jgi:hypothetical protein
MNTPAGFSSIDHVTESRCFEPVSIRLIKLRDIALPDENSIVLPVIDKSPLQIFSLN